MKREWERRLLRGVRRRERNDMGSLDDMPEKGNAM